MQQNVNIEINEAYYPYIESYSHRDECYYGSAGSGKSYFITQKLLFKALKSKRKILVIRKVGAKLRTSVFALFVKLIDEYGLTKDTKINNTYFDITLPNGSIILFSGLDDSEKIKSIEGITDIWIEECTEITLEEYIQLGLRLRAMLDDCQRIVSFNPISKANWVYTYFGFDTGIPPQNTLVVKTTYKDNIRFLPKSYIDELEGLKETNYAYYMIYVMGEFCSLDKLIYKFEVQEFDHREVGGTYCFGLDFGYVADETALIAFKADVDKKILRIFDEHYQKAMLNDAIANMIKYKGYAKELIIGDCAEPKSLEEIRRCGIPRLKAARKGKDSILQGIQKIQQFKIIVHPKCENVITEFSNYSWEKDKRTGDYINKPIDKYNHLCDALRYGIQIVDKSNKIKTLDKSLFGF